MLARVRAARRRPSIADRTEAGLALAVTAALISGLAVYLNAFAVKLVPDPAVYTTAKNGVAAVILLALMLSLGGASAVRSLDRRRSLGVLAVAVVGGSVPFVLFFTGLAAASAPSAAFIQKTLFVWVAFLAVPFLGEDLGVATIAGLGLLLVGQALVLPPTGIAWGTGELLILAATVLWAIETILVRRLLATIPGHAMAALRMGLGVVLLVGYLVATGRAEGLLRLSAEQWSWTLVTGVILAAYVATWFAALQRAPASVVTAVLVLGAVVTGGLTAATKGTVPSPAIVGGYLLIVAGAAIVLAWSRHAARRVVANVAAPLERVRARAD